MGWTTPITHAVGDPIVVSDWNTYVRDNQNYLYGDAAWTPASLTNGWAGATIGYRRAGSLVILKGLSTTTGTGSIFTLPVGYRPLTSNSPIPIVSGSSTSSGQGSDSGVGFAISSDTVKAVIQRLDGGI